MTKDEALRLALEALEDLGMKHYENTGEVLYKETFTAIKAALEAKDEPVAWATQLNEYAHIKWGAKRPEYPMVYEFPLYTSPQPAQQEPVAWLHTKIEGVVVPHRPADLDKHPDRWEALYKTPPSCPTCKALSRTVMLDQTSHDTTPPQRTWVGLTDEHKEGLIYMTDPNPEPHHLRELIDVVEYELRSKNT